MGKRRMLRSVNPEPLAPQPLAIPAPILARAQEHDRQAQAHLEQRNELIAAGMELLGISTETKSHVDISTGIVTLTPVIDVTEQELAEAVEQQKG